MSDDPKTATRSGKPDPKPDDRSPEGEKPVETGQRERPDPTRYGDWEINGRCIDF